MQVYASAVGQYDNLGDTVLRRGFLDGLRRVGPLNVFVGKRDADYLSALGLGEADTLVGGVGACPACDAPQRFALGQRWRERTSLRCEQCGRAIVLELPAAPPAA